MMNVSINCVVKIYNDKRVRLGIVKEITDHHVVVQGIFSKVINKTYRVRKENIEVINLLHELGLNETPMR